MGFFQWLENLFNGKDVLEDEAGYSAWEIDDFDAGLIGDEGWETEE